jgi:hypothetical protein
VFTIGIPGEIDDNLGRSRAEMVAPDLPFILFETEENIRVRIGPEYPVEIREIRDFFETPGVIDGHRREAIETTVGVEGLRLGIVMMWNPFPGLRIRDSSNRRWEIPIREDHTNGGQFFTLPSGVAVFISWLVRGVSRGTGIEVRRLKSKDTGDGNDVRYERYSHQPMMTAFASLRRDISHGPSTAIRTLNSGTQNLP